MLKPEQALALSVNGGSSSIQFVLFDPAVADLLMNRVEEKIAKACAEEDQTGMRILPLNTQATGLIPVCDKSRS